MHDFFSEFNRHLRSRLRIVTCIAVAILLGIAGPFGTFVELNIFERLAYWSGVVFISMVLVQSIKVVVDLKFHGQGTWIKMLLTVVILTLVLSPILNLMTDTVIGDQSMYGTPLWLFASLIFSLTLFALYVQHLLGVTVFRKRARIFSRFGDSKANEVNWITVRDHYVDVYTNRGKETLLMRFSDALAELDGLEGLQIHRSHWVAAHAGVQLKKDNGRYAVVLLDGTEVPVSRGYQADAVRRFS